jgi:hypothetical protein
MAAPEYLDERTRILNIIHLALVNNEWYSLLNETPVNGLHGAERERA